MGYDMSTIEPMSEADQKALDEAVQRRAEIEALLPSVKDDGPRGDVDVDAFSAALDAGVTVWEARQQACAVKGSDEWLRLRTLLDEAYEQASAADKTYFRANIAGMGFLREAMWVAGMAVDSTPPSWPECDGFTWEEYEQAQESGTLTPSMLAYAEAQRATVTAHGAEGLVPRPGPGLPLHKFGSNDGWVVTPTEIDDALRQADLDAAQEWIAVQRGDGLLGFWQRWLDYLAYARDHGGFQVW